MGISVQSANRTHNIDGDEVFILLAMVYSILSNPIASWTVYLFQNP